MHSLRTLWTIVRNTTADETTYANHALRGSALRVCRVQKDPHQCVEPEETHGGPYRRAQVCLPHLRQTLHRVLLQKSPHKHVPSDQKCPTKLSESLVLKVQSHQHERSV